MDPININNASAEELLNAHAHLWNHMYSYLNSMALRCAIQLGISDAIHKQGKAMTLSELAIALSIPPNKAPCISRIMRLLFHSNFFSKRTSSSGEEAFDLTIHSQLLLKDHPLSVAPFALLALDPIVIEPTFHFGTMASDAQFVVSLLVIHDEFKGLIEGVESLIDVGGKSGTMAKAMSKLFPKLTCIVFDLPYVVKGVEGCQRNLKYVGGDMFEVIPPDQAVLLKILVGGFRWGLGRWLVGLVWLGGSWVWWVGSWVWMGWFVGLGGVLGGFGWVFRGLGRGLVGVDEWGMVVL
ncbi:putative O-methyltransferase 3 [Bienertia sinuspersici]